MPDSGPLAPGTVIGAYRIEARLGEGGMGTVWRAQDTRLNRPVAIKVLSAGLADADARRRFQREAQMASALNHPHILTVHDVGEHEGRQYLVTEFIDGGTLKEWARAERRTWKQIVELLTGVADGLAAAHGATILHRDIKPANILVAQNGYAKLADFGLAKLAERDTAPQADGDSTLTLTEGVTRPGMVVGTIAYMSPEQASGEKIDSRSDTFSFGVVMYELLAGHRPFTGASDLEVLKTIIHGPAEPLPASVPPALRAVVEKCLEKDPADRYHSMREVVVDLRRLSRETPSAAITAVAAPRPTRKWLPVAAVVALLAVAGIAWRMWPGAAAPKIGTIAVLPLRNISSDTSQDYFTDGITEAIISNLAKIHSLRVISRTSILRYKGSTKSLPEIAKELRADAVVEASVQRVGDHVRINASLIQASTDATLWSKEFDREISDVLRLEADVASEIGQGIQAHITPEETRRLSNAKSVMPMALEEYLLGQLYFRNGDYGSAVRHYEEATRQQPDYAAAHGMLSMALHLGEAFGATTRAQVETKGRAAALKALELDPEQAEAHLAMAGILWFEDWDWAGAEQSFKRALELNPGSAEICGCRLFFLTTTGRVPEAIAFGQASLQRDPLSDFVELLYGNALYFARRYEEGAVHLQRALELNPQNLLARQFLSDVYSQSGKLQEARTLLDRPEFRNSAAFAAVNARLGRRDEALRILEALGKDAPDPYRNALAYFALGDQERGFEWLARAIDRRQLFVSQALFDPAMPDSVRSQPRFQELMAKLKLPAR